MDHFMKIRVKNLAVLTLAKKIMAKFKCVDNRSSQLKRKKFNTISNRTNLFLSRFVTILGSIFFIEIANAHDLSEKERHLSNGFSLINGGVYSGLQDNSAADLSSGFANNGLGIGTYFLKGDFNQGMSKICVYDRMGETYYLQINMTSLYPLSL